MFDEAMGGDALKVDQIWKYGSPLVLILVYSEPLDQTRPVYGNLLGLGFFAIIFFLPPPSRWCILSEIRSSLSESAIRTFHLMTFGE
jgi:hypothetical protein